MDRFQVYHTDELQSSSLYQIVTNLITYHPVIIYPPCLQELVLKTDQPVTNFPDSLQSLCVIGVVNFSLADLPSSLQRLSIQIAKDFNQPLDRLPCSLRHLLVDSYDSFNQPLDRLPPVLETLTIAGVLSFNQPVDHLPPSLKALTIFGRVKFNQPVDKLPPTLEKLHISALRRFNQPLDKLPSSLRILVIESEQVDLPFDYLPPSLEYLSYTDPFRSALVHRWNFITNPPASLQEFYFNGKSMPIPRKSETKGESERTQKF